MKHCNIEEFGQVAIPYFDILSNISDTATVWKYIVNTWQVLFSFFSLLYTWWVEDLEDDIFDR